MIDHGDQAYFPGAGRQTTGTPSRVLQLREGTDLIVRADGQLQFGTVPEVARVLSLPTGVGVEQIHQVMQELRRSMPDATVIRLLGHCGLPAVHARGIVEELLKAGFLSARPAELRTRVHVLGHSTLSRAVLSQLRGLGIPASGTAPGTPSFGRLCEDDLVVLAGMLFPPADISYHLMDVGTAHLTCGAVDSRVAIGPLILPGQTPCLACLDATYLVEDAQWRTVRSRVTEVMAPQSEQVIALTASLTATTVREILVRRGTSTDGRTWLVPELLHGRHYFDPLTLKVTGTLPTRLPGCPCCALAPDAVR